MKKKKNKKGLKEQKSSNFYKLNCNKTEHTHPKPKKRGEKSSSEKSFPVSQLVEQSNTEYKWIES